MLPANEQLPSCYKEVTAILGKMGRLLLFAVTNLDNEANNCDYEHAKLEHVRVCDHNPLPPFLSVGGRKKTFSLRETRWGAARLPFIGSTTAKLSHFSAKSNPTSQIEVGFSIKAR